MSSRLESLLEVHLLILKKLRGCYLKEILILNKFSFEDKDPRFTRLKSGLALRLLSNGLFYIRAMAVVRFLYPQGWIYIDYLFLLLYSFLNPKIPEGLKHTVFHIGFTAGTQNTWSCVALKIHKCFLCIIVFISFWWVLWNVNNIMLLPNQIVPGLLLVIP